MKSSFRRQARKKSKFLFQETGKYTSKNSPSETLTLTTAGAAFAAASAIAYRLKQPPCLDGKEAPLVEGLFAADPGNGDALDTLTIGVRLFKLQPSQVTNPSTEKEEEGNK